MNNFYNETIYIPTIHIDAFTDKIFNLNKKAKKLGFEPITFVQHDEYRKEEYTRETLYQGEGPFGTIKKFKVMTQKFTISGQTPQVKDFVFIAALESTENGNIVKKFSESPLDFSQYGSKCEHCNINRRRKQTYIIQNTNTGEYKQVGSTCLDDFLGSDSLQSALFQAESLYDLIYIKESFYDPFYDGSSGGFSQFPLEEYLSYVVKVIEVEGWASKKSVEGKLGSKSTAETAWMEMSSRRQQPTQEQIDQASSVIDWALNMQPNNDYERNLHIIAKNGRVTHSQYGFAASMVNACKTFHEKILAEKNSKQKPSEFQGTVGQKISFDAIVLKCLSFDSYYGRTNLTILQDDDGNIFKWSTGSHVNFVAGNKHSFTGTVKEHTTYNQQKQTVLTRVKEV